MAIAVDFSSTSRSLSSNFFKSYLTSKEEIGRTFSWCWPLKLFLGMVSHPLGGHEAGETAKTLLHLCSPINSYSHSSKAWCPDFLMRPFAFLAAVLLRLAISKQNSKKLAMVSQPIVESFKIKNFDFLLYWPHYGYSMKERPPSKAILNFLAIKHQEVSWRRCCCCRLNSCSSAVKKA